MSFEAKLRQGKFVISECTKCNKIIWPPNEICNSCFGKAKWREGPNKGKVLEFSKKEDKIFCLVEFDEGIRFIGTLENESTPKIGQEVKIRHCSIEDGDYSFNLSLS